MKSLVAILLASLWATAALAQPTAVPSHPGEMPSNDEMHVSPARWIGDANLAQAHVTHDVIFSRTILSAGDPKAPGEPGAVLSYAKEVAQWTLPAGGATSLVAQPELLILYVENGGGRLDDGKLSWDLRPGMMIMVPPNRQHRLVAGDSPIQMIALTQTLEPGVKPASGIVVRDVEKLGLTEKNAHWSHMAKAAFLGPDGLYPTEHIFIVYLNPMTIGSAHAHTPGQEEVWVKVSDAPALMQIGSEIRPWPKNAGFIAPPNGQTVHAAINGSDQPQAFFYYGRLRPSTQILATDVHSTDPAIAQALVRATIAGRPLAPAPSRDGR